VNGSGPSRTTAPGAARGAERRRVLRRLPRGVVPAAIGAVASVIALGLGGPGDGALAVPFVSELAAGVAGWALAVVILSRRRNRRYRERAERFRAVLEAGGIGSWSFDAATWTVDLDARCAEMFGVSPVRRGDFRPSADRIHPDDRPVVERALIRAIRHRTSYDADYRVLLPDGSTRHVVGHGTYLERDGVPGGRVVGVNLDVTPLRRAEDDRAASDARSDRIVEEAPLPILLHAEDGTIVSVNREWCRLSGYAAQELPTIEAWIERAFGDRAEEMREAIRGIFDQGEAVDEGRQTIRTASGGERIWALRAAPLGALPDGRRVAMMAALDVTEQDLARDLQRSNQELEQFAYVASHDLQEPLRMVAGFVRLLAQRYEGRLDADADKYIGFALDGTERMQHLIADLLDYSRAGRGSVPDTPVDTDAVIEGVLAIFRSQLSELGAQVTLDPLPALRGNRAQLQAVFQNLIENAIKYRSEAPLRIHVGVERREGRPVITVSDNGIGIDPGQTERVFRPFQRLHARSEYEGSGIGLAIVERIVHRYQGEVWAESDGEQGTTFCLELPCVHAPEEEKPGPPEALEEEKPWPPEALGEEKPWPPASD